MRGHRITFSMLVTVALASCGSSANDASNGSGSSASDSATSAPASTPSDITTTSPTDGGGDDASDDVLDSVHWGPDDPPIPDEYRVFAVDSAGAMACDGIDNRAEGDEFWTLARDICRVFTGEGDWPAAATVPPPPQEGNVYQRCLDQEMSVMLADALAWHAAHPGEAPIVRFPSNGTHSPCQTSLYDVAVTDLDVDTANGCLNDASADVPTPGIPVTISAPGITGFANPRASLDGASLCVIADSQDIALRTFVVVVPTSGEAHSVTIDVETNYGISRASVVLPAIDVEPATTADSVDPTETTGTTADEQHTPDGP